MVYYEVMKHASNCDKIDLPFDRRYFEKGVNKGTRSGSGEGSQYLLHGDSNEIPQEMAESFQKQPKQK